MNVNNGYWCLVCCRFIPSDEYGIIIHDYLEHPEQMTFDEDENPQ